MFKPRKHPLSFKTSEGCRMLLDIVLEGADSNDLSKQKAAVKALEGLCKKRCTKALTFIIGEFCGSNIFFKQRLCKKAKECL